MPQSIQIVPRWSYPYVETIINDYSQVVDKTNNTPIDPVVTYAFPFVSSKGIDNTFVRKHSVSRFVSTFGNTNYKKYGQPLMMPLAVLANPNVYVWGMRVMPVNAAYSNNLITLKYRVDKKSDDVDPSQRKFRINFTQRALTEATNNKEFIDTAYTIQRDPNRAYIPTDDEDPDAPLEVGKYTVKQYVVTTSDDPDAIMVVDDSVENLDSTQVHYTDVISTVYSNNELELVTLQNYVDVYTREHTELSPENIAKILADQLERIDELTPIVEKYRLELDPDEVDLSSEVQAIRNIQVGDYVKVYEWKIAPFMGIRSAGRGVYGDNYRVRISPNTNYEKEYGIKMFDFQILSMEEGLQTVASYTGALSSSDKYESITLINDILENADDGDVPVYVYVSEENLKVVYEDYVKFLKELHPDLIEERDHKLERYTEAYRINKGLDLATAQLHMSKMINGKQRAYSTDRIVIDDDESEGIITLATMTDFRALEIVEDNRQYYDNATMIRLREVQGKIPNYIHVSAKSEGARLVVSDEFPAQSFKPNKMIRIGTIDTADRAVSINDYVAATGVGNFVVRGVIKSVLDIVNELKNINNLISATADKAIVDFDQFDPLYAQKVASSALIPCISFNDGVTTDGSVPIFAETSGVALKKGDDGYFANPRYVEILDDGDTSEPSIVYPFPWTHPVTTQIAPERVKVIRYEKSELSVSDTNEEINGVSYLEIIADDAESSTKGQIKVADVVEKLVAAGYTQEAAETAAVPGKYLKSTLVYFEQLKENEYSLYDRMYTGGKNKLQVIENDDSKNYDIQTQVEKRDVLENLVTGYMRCDSRRTGALEVVDDSAVPTTTQVRKSAVISDIADISVGDHVLNVTAASIYVDPDDPVYVIKKVKPLYQTFTEYTIVSPTDEGALKVVADADYEEGSTTTIKISTVNASTNPPADVVVPSDHYFISTASETGSLEVVAGDADPFDADTQIKITDTALIADLPDVTEGDFVIKKEVAAYVAPKTTDVPQFKKYSIDEEELETITDMDELMDIYNKAGIEYPAKNFTKPAVYLPVVQTDIIYLYPDEDTGKMPVDDDVKGPVINVDGSINTSRVAYTTDAVQWTLQQEIDECLINALNGTYDRKILSPRRIPVDAWFDANFSFPVKQALCDLVTARNDAPVFLDTGISDKVYSTERMNALIEEYKEFTEDTARYNTKLISKNLQHYKIREETTMKRVDVSITYFLAKQFAEHVLNFGTHFPFVKARCELSGHLRDTLQPALEDFEAEKKELLYNNHFNYFETRDDNIFQRASQSTSQAELSDLSEENNIFTLYTLKRILENDIHDSLYDFADATSRQTFTAYETAKFASWIGTKVLSLSIHFDVSEWEFDHSILHCYVSVVFRGLQKRAILEIDINKRVYDGESESATGTIAI